MNSESRLIVELWESVRDTVPAANRVDVACLWLRAFDEYGIDSKDMSDIIGEDKALDEAHTLLFEEEEDDYDDEDEYFDDE